MINLNTVGTTTKSIRSTFESSKQMEANPELFKEFLEPFFQESPPKKLIIDPSKELSMVKKEDSLSMDELFAYENQVIFSFIPNQKNSKLLTFSTNRENGYENEKVNDLIESTSANGFSLTQKEKSVIEDVLLKNSEQVELKMTEVTHNEKEVSQDLFLKDRLLGTEGESIPISQINDDTLTEDFVLREQMETILEKQEGIPTISFEAAENQTAFTTIPILKEQTVFSKINLTVSQPEQFIQDFSENIQIFVKNTTKETNQVVQVKLSPENLGEMEIYLEWQDDHVEAKIFVQEQNVKELLETHLQQIQQFSAKESLIDSFTIAVRPQQVACYQFSQDLGQRKSLMQSFKPNHGRLKREKKEISKNMPYKFSHGLSLYI